LAHEGERRLVSDSIPNTPLATPTGSILAQHRDPMRAVPGAHFKFDWTVNPAIANIPLSNWYPGDDVVDIIGVDAYDAGVPASVPFSGRWNYLYNEPTASARWRRSPSSMASR